MYVNMCTYSTCVCMHVYVCMCVCKLAFMYVCVLYLYMHVVVYLFVLVMSLITLVLMSYFSNVPILTCCKLPHIEVSYLCRQVTHFNNPL